MSNPGLSVDDIRRMMLAQQLMGNGQSRGGLGGAGSQIMGALAMRNAMQQADPMHVNVTPAANASFGNRMGMKLGNLFGLGG